jgi:hypothetical protein
MDYKKIYDSLIERGKNRLNTGKLYYESHHIIPRCMNGTDEQYNLVYLTPEEHYIAHQLLIKIYPDNLKLAHAANMMCVNRTTNKLYGWVRRRLSKSMINDNPNKNGISNKKRKGKYNLSKEARNNISAGLKLNNTNVGSKNGMFNIKPWLHPRATIETKQMWKDADKYFEWWKNCGLKHGQNAMARHFNEKYKMTHSNLVKYFRQGWIPFDDEEWKNFRGNTCQML